jgi:putative sigma-54 modulation protein
MKLTVTGRHLAVSTTERAAIAGKVAHLDRILNASAVSAGAIVSRERGLVVCELTVQVRGSRTLVGVGRDRRLPVAAARAADKVGQQALRLTGRRKAKRDGRGRAPARRAGPAGELEPASTPAPRVIRSRDDDDVKPMSLDDAVLLLSSRPHGVVVFRHVLTDAVAVVYRRPDGHVGLIEPEV